MIISGTKSRIGKTATAFVIYHRSYQETVNEKGEVLGVTAFDYDVEITPESAAIIEAELKKCRITNNATPVVSGRITTTWGQTLSSGRSYAMAMQQAKELGLAVPDRPARTFGPARPASIPANALPNIPEAGHDDGVNI